MDFQALYTHRDGRISRKSFWIGALLLGVVNIIIALLILPIIGLGGPNVAAIMQAQSDPAMVSSLIAVAIQTSAWGSLIIFLIFAYPAYCLSLKRRHDRNNNGLDLLIYFALSLVLLLVQALGLGYTMAEFQGIPVPVPSLLFSVLGGAVGIFGIYLLVVLGFLKGTEGTNNFGPDPLTAGATAAA